MKALSEEPASATVATPPITMCNLYLITTSCVVSSIAMGWREPSGRRQCCLQSFGRPCDFVHMRGAQTHLSIASSAPNHWGGEWEIANDCHCKSSLAGFSRNIARIRNSQAARAVLRRRVIGVTHPDDLRPGSERWFFLVAWARQSRHSVRPPMGWRLMASRSAISSG
jgi:hypothetical protein